MAISSISGVSNVTLWDLARKADPAFASHTSKGTADLFTEKGFESITRNGLDTINDFFRISMRVAFQMLNVARARNPLANSGLVEVYDTPNGGYVQRMAMGAIKPVTPAYRGLTNGSSVDPFIVRKPELAERFFEQNFDFQNFITMQDFNVKTIFISEYGMGQVLAGIMQSLQAAYTKQEYFNTLEALNAAINSTNTPLQDSQVIRLSSWTDAGVTTAELTQFLKVAKNVIRDLDASASSSKYNAAKFDDVVTSDDLVMLVRPSILTDIDAMNALNRPELGIDLSVTPVENFGGMKPYTINASTGEADTLLQPIYDANGVQVAYVDGSVTVNGAARFDATSGKWIVNVTSGGTTADTNQTVTENAITWVDPNAEVLAVIAQKGVIFENAQNPYRVEPIRNPRGMYDNYFANRPGTAIVYDAYRDLIVIAKPAS